MPHPSSWGSPHSLLPVTFFPALGSQVHGRWSNFSSGLWVPRSRQHLLKSIRKTHMLQLVGEGQTCAPGPCWEPARMLAAHWDVC